MKMSSANIHRTRYVSKGDVFALDRCNPGDPHAATVLSSKWLRKKIYPRCEV